MTSITVSTRLVAPADVVWEAVQKPETFVQVVGRLLRFPAAERRAQPMEEGSVIDGWIFLFRLLPFSRHRIEVVELDPDTMTLATVEGGGLIRVWDHRIVVEAIDDRTCHYVDEIEIDAGVLTPVVVAFAQVFYRYRQRRWRRLAPTLTAGSDGEGV